MAAVVLSLAACRAGSPTSGTPLQLASVHVGAPLTFRTSTFTSSQTDIQPIQDTMRGAFSFGGGLGAGPAWDFDGNTEEYNARVLGAASHVVGDPSFAPRSIGSYNVLAAELAALSADPTLATLLNASPLPTLPGNALLTDIALGFDFSQTNVRWRASGSTPVLRVDTPLVVSPALDPLIRDLFNAGPYRVAMPVDIGVRRCGSCTSPRVECRDAPGIVAAGYRTGIASSLGYASTEVNATYPDLRLNFDLLRVTGPTAISGSTTYNAACVLSIAELSFTALADMFGLDLTDPSTAALAVVFEFARSAVGVLKYIASFAVCDYVTGLTAAQVEPAIASLPMQLTTNATTGTSVGSLMDLLVNPPVLDRRIAGTRIMALPAGTVADSGIVHAAVTVGAFGTTPSTLATGPTGGYTDTLFSTVASGGCADVSVRVDLTPVSRACATGIGLSRLDRDSVCPACAPDGRCAADPACSFVCDGAGGFLPSAIVPAFTPGITPACPSGTTLQITAAPNVANLLSSAPLFGETIRRWFSWPLPRGARYSTAAPGALSGTAAFGYIIDGDDDCVSREVDICPDAFDPDQTDDGDGDIYGAACDACPGVSFSGALANADQDGDGTANACDCDLDGDGCNNEGQVNATTACAPTGTGVFDRSPGVAVSRDFDGDGISDDCDPDRDNDGVADELDNCPFGDGDGLFEPGSSDPMDACSHLGDPGPGNDQNPCQRDSGGLGEGDLCDRVCPFPAAPLCNSDLHFAGGAFGSLGSIADFIPGAGSCVGTVGGLGLCQLSLDWLCPGQEYDRCWLPDSFDELSFVDDSGFAQVELNAEKLGLSGGWSSATAMVPDVDGDGRDDVLVSAPRSIVCPESKLCYGAPGVVALLGSSHGKLFSELMGSEDGGLFGSAMARLGDVVAIGAPGAGSGRGAVYFYRVAGPSFELLSTVRGTASTDRFGSSIEPAFGADTAAPSFLVAAPGARSGAGVLVIANASEGITRRYEGPVANATMSHGVVVGTASDFVVVGAIPHASADRGTLAFFQGRGRGFPQLVRGAAGARLGERLAVVDGDVAATASGLGAIVRYSRRGSMLGSVTSTLPRFGTGMASPGDLDGDGRDDLLVGFAIDAARQDIHSIAVYSAP